MIGYQEKGDTPTCTYSFSYKYMEFSGDKKKVDRHRHRDTEMLDTYLEGIMRMLTISEFDGYRINDMIDVIGVIRMVVHDTPPQVSTLSLKHLHSFHIFLLRVQ